MTIHTYCITILTKCIVYHIEYTRVASCKITLQFLDVRSLRVELWTLLYQHFPELWLLIDVFNVCIEVGLHVDIQTSFFQCALYLSLNLERKVILVRDALLTIKADREQTLHVAQ